MSIADGRTPPKTSSGTSAVELLLFDPGKPRLEVFRRL
jgi:hypothetical protein